MTFAIELLTVCGWVAVCLTVVLLMAPFRNDSKPRRHSNAIKLKAITDVENGRKQTEVADEYGISPGLMNDWIKAKEKIRKAVDSGAKESISRIRPSYYPKTESAVLKWLHNVRDHHGSINGVQLRERASEFAKLIPDECSFKASTGWLAGFMKRNDVIFRTLKGEANSVNVNDVETFKTGTLADVLKRYDANDIFNCDEAGLQYGATARKTLTFKGGDAHGTKEDKRRLTLLFCANMTGLEKKTAFSHWKI